MDSFFSLFDPSDSVQNKPKKQRHKTNKTETQLVAIKKPDQPRGRRKNRKSLVKNETLPEESSFLCEPDLTTDILVKGGSYIESFIAINNNLTLDNLDDLARSDEKKPRRRNSGRKNRRKRNKMSPANDFLPGNENWNSRQSSEEKTYWNNKLNYTQKNCDEIGRNVNDLQKPKEDSYEYNKKSKRKSEPFDVNWRTECKDVLDYEQNEVYNVIDKLEKVSLKDDMYMAGDFKPEDLENDLLYSSDDLDEFWDDSSSDVEDSGDEAYGSLPPEPRFGNVEYKLQLVNPSERRFQHLVTQLKWRLRSGGGSAVYVVGVRDCGALRGLRARALRASLHTLRRMSATLRASLRHVTARRVAPNRAVAEVYIRKLADTQQSVELRLAVMGANEAGKSTLIGVLTQGELDNGRGSARLNMFRHLHEVRSGRTSSLSHEILGFDSQGNVVNYGCSELMTAERIGERSAKLVSFLDLAGHRKYQRTTVHGLTGYSPHYAMLVVSATAGINRMTEEHIGLLLALDMPFFIVITKLDLAPANLQPVLACLREILETTDCKKCPLLITDEHLARTCVAPQRLILDSLDTKLTNGTKQDDIQEIETVPVFPVSCVRGVGLNALHGYLLALEPPPIDLRPLPEEEACEFQIDEIFHVGDSAGPVVGGLLARGQLHEGDYLLVGPLDTGDFVEISVKTIYRNRVPCGSVKAGQSASLGLSRNPPNIRQGMVLVAIPDGYNQKNHKKPTFCSCPPGECQKNTKELHQVESKLPLLNGKNKWKKEKNILRDLANVETCLVKNLSKDVNDNLYIEDEVKISQVVLNPVESGSEDSKDLSSESEKECSDEILLDDPNDPRGCLFFQATVRVLRHSTAIYPGFQATVHIGNVRQTAVIEGIMSHSSVLRAGESASALFRFVRQPEYVRVSRKILFRDGLETRGVGRVTQVFPYMPN